MFGRKRSGKPPSTSAMMCPYFKKEMRKVCQDCELWEAIQVVPVSHDGVRGNPVDHWGCTIKHQLVISVDLVKAISGLQKATESDRNTAWKESQQNLTDVIELAKSQQTFNRDILHKVRASLSAVAERIGLAAPQAEADETKMLNGSTKQ